MECPNCHFHNMPGNTRCLKCGGRLDVAAAEIAIEPPRASAGAKRLRKWLPRWTRRLRFGGMRDQVPTAARPGGGRLNMARLPVGCYFCMIVPGWGQWYLGNAARGRNYFVPCVLLILVALLRWQTVLASVALYAALCVHLISIADLLCRPARGAR